MNKLLKQFVAFAIAAVMVCGMLPVSAMAVENHDHSHGINSNVPAFTSTEDLIEQVKAQLIEAGKITTAQPDDEASVEAVEHESDYSYAQAMTMIGLGFFNNRIGTEGEIDTTRLNLTTETMNTLVQAVLKAYYLEDSIQVEYVEQDGIVTAVKFTLTDAYASVLDELHVEETEVVSTVEIPTVYSENTRANAYKFPFTDVTGNYAWAREAIEYLHKNGIVNGTSATTFGPGVQMTRAMAVTMLWRSEDEPKAKTSNNFTDLKKGEYYVEAVNWAAENKIVAGKGDGKFDPNGKLTREELVTIMYRYAGEFKGNDVSKKADLKRFKDASTISSWAKDAVAWAVAGGIIKGYENNGTFTFQPKKVAVRAEFAQILYKYLTMGHDLQHVAAVAQTCEKDGSIEYWQCKTCGKYFADENATQELTAAELVIPGGHGNTITAVPEVPATCTETGVAAHYSCQCGLVILDAQGNQVTDTSVLIIPATGHAPAADATDVVWSWVRTSKDDPEADPREPADYVITYNPETKEIGTGLKQVVTWDCADVTFTCGGCGEEFTAETETTSYVMTEEWIEEATNNYATEVATQLITDYVTEKAMAYYMETGTAPTEEQTNAWAAEAQQDAALMGQVEQQATIKAFELYHDLNSVIYVATTGNTIKNADGVTEGLVVQENKLNHTLDQLQRDWGTLQTFNADYPQYLGLAAPYWTEKNTEESPLNAILYLTNQQEQPFIPNADMDYMVSMLSQAFMSYVMQYGYMLDEMIAEVKAVTDHEELDTIDKLLLTHDWMAQHATFDMQSLVDLTEGTITGNDPIAMTAFGTLLNDQIQKAEDATWDGGICLGYTAAYAMLVQHVMGEIVYDEEAGEYVANVDEEKGTMIDFVQIKYLTNVAESSIASGDSGFGDGDAMFNSPHFLNAVRLNDEWYYIDSCYNDVNVEVISQQRVETDGNVSHNSFLLAPATWEEMYDGNYQYMDSLYDGYDWLRVSDGQGGYKMQDNKGNVYETEQAAKDAQAADEELQIFYVYEKTEDTTETRYTDDTYETAWFVSANSPIYYDAETQHFYYTSGAVNSYSSMKDMFGDSEEGGESDNGMSMDQDEMLQYKHDPSAQDKIVRRPVGATNVPSSSGGMMGSSQTTDSHAEVLFHFGYGKIGAEAHAQYETDANENSFSSEGMGSIQDSEKGPYYDTLMVADREYFNAYPDLTHSTVVMDGVIYFNIGNAIYSFNMPINELASDITQMTNLELVLVKEYDQITYTQNSKRFEGMSFEAAKSGSVMRYHPIAALSVHDVYTWSEDSNGNPVKNTAETLFVSIGTNLSNSYKDENDENYKVEARNYNGDYYRFMEDDETAAEKNENVEFMWCANIVEKMNVADLLEDLESGATQTVTVASYCEHAGYTQTRTSAFGLVKSEKTFLEDDPADVHQYAMDEEQGTNICSVCLDDHSHNFTYTDATPVFTWVKNAEGALVANATVACEDIYCTGIRDDLEETNTYDAENDVYLVSVTYQGTEYTDAKTMDQFEHNVHNYGEPVFNWNEDNTACTATFTCTVDSSICEDEDGLRVTTVDCTVTTNELGEPTATVADPANAAKTYSVTIHTYGAEPMLVWAEEGYTCDAVYTCTTCTEGTEGHTKVYACHMETANYVAATCQAEGSMDHVATYTDADGNVFTATKTEILPKTGHSYEATFAWADDCSSCAITLKCTTEGCVNSLTDVCTVNGGEVVKEPNCTEAGQKVYTATYTHTDGKPYTDTKTVELPATGHPGYDAQHKCTACGQLDPSHEHTYTMGAAGTETWSYNAETGELSCTAHYSCSCGNQDNETVTADATGVAYFSKYGTATRQHTHAAEGTCSCGYSAS